MVHSTVGLHYMSPELYSPTFWLQLALAVIGVGGLVAALKTLNKMERQTKAAEIAANAAKKGADTTEEALRLTQRADILLDQAQLNIGDAQSGAGAIVILVFKNFGYTRAINVVFHTGLLTPVAKKGSPVIGPVTLGPNDTQRIAFERFGNWMNEDTAAQIFGGKVLLQFFAEVTYEDLFGVHHFSRYFGTWNHETRAFRVDKHEAN